MTAIQSDEQDKATDPRLRASLRRYQVISYIVGTFLLVLCVAMVLKYAFDSPRLMSIVGPIHGFGYMVYLALAFDLARQVGWPVKKTILILAAGTIPFMSFVAERKVTHQVKAA